MMYLNGVGIEARKLRQTDCSFARHHSPV